MVDIKVAYGVRKWTVILLTIIVFTAFQGGYEFLRIFSIKPLFLMPLAICFSVFHNQIQSAIVGGICGALWDVVSGRIFGFSALLLMILSIIVSLIVAYYLKSNLLNTLILSVASLFVYYFFDFLFRYFIWDVSGSIKILIFRILPTILFTLIITIPIYFLCRFYHNKADSFIV